MQQNLTLFKMFGNVQKIQNRYEGQNTVELEQLTVLSIARK